MFGLKIFVRVQTFRRVPPVLPRNFCHPGRECNPDIRKWVVMQNLAIDLIFCCVLCLFSRFKEGWLQSGRRRLSEWWWADSDLHDLHWTTNKPNKYSRMVFYDRNNNILYTCINKRRGKNINVILSQQPCDNICVQHKTHLWSYKTLKY